VLSGAPGDYVYLVNANNTVSVRKVALGASDGQNTAILSGLTAGDTVVVDGTDRLSDGAQISVSTGAAKPATGTQQVPATPGSPPGSKARKKPSAAAQGASTTS
jgi:multidrug efflux system membrane fusion protein